MWTRCNVIVIAGGFITVRLRWCVPKSCRNVVSVLRPLVPSRDKVCRVTALAKTSRRSKPKTLSPAKTEYIELRSEENELWRLDEAIRIIQSGGVSAMQEYYAQLWKPHCHLSERLF